MMNSINKEAIQESIKAHLTAGLEGKHFSVVINDRLYALFARSIDVDVAVYDLEGKPIAIIEIQGFPQAWAMLKQMDASLWRSFGILGVRYSIVTDGEVFLMCSKTNTTYQKTNLSTVIDTINNGLPVLGPTPSDEQIIQAIVEAASKNGLKQSNTVKSFLERTRSRRLFKADRTTGRVEFYSSRAEDSFFSLLIRGRIPPKLCRFTTRHNLFLLLKERKQNMCSIVCMNDKSEETYADKKIGFSEGWAKVQIENNNCFILSLLPQEKSDDLTMWRLYGDDAKGVCLNYEIKEVRRRRKIKGDFFMSVVNYGENEKSHPELDFLKGVLQININHWHIKLNRWHIWKHFFKSFRFRDENEVRLLYLSNGREKVEKQWIENEVSGIVSKMLLFPMIPINTFPLCLTSVIVGPKAPDPRKITEQFSYLVDQEWRDYPTQILMRQSAIKEYR